MRLHKLRLVLVGLLCCLGLAACASTTSTTSPTSPTSPIDKEAAEMNQKYWEEHFVKCGDSYYGEASWGALIQHRGVTFQVKPSQLTDLDKENGYEWIGTGVMKASSTREREVRREWTDWVITELLLTRMKKKKGKWEIFHDSVEVSTNIPRYTCEELSKP